MTLIQFFETSNTRYQGKLSGPLIDRIDLIIDVPAVTQSELTAPAAGEPTDIVRKRVAEARARQTDRQGTENARLGPKALDDVAVLDDAGHRLMSNAMQKLDLSARAYHRILRVARTIADLAGSASIAVPHLAEAIQYRRSLAR
ncbi:MAG: ATP-binding protein [Burkholderiales bacterium]|nr:ATP-binding protein [Burkholderiales bacterium]